MKRILCVGLFVGVSLVSFAQGPGRGVFKPGQTENAPSEAASADEYGRGEASVRRDDYGRSPGGGHLMSSPFAFCVGGWGLPYGRSWAICGLRLNLGIPGWTKQYEAVYGLDVGLSGETFGEAGGFLVNVFNNTTRDVYGVAVAGFWNDAKGSGSAALQLAAFYNGAEKLDGVQIGLVNTAHELHGVQIGLVNRVVNGGGLQIGLWNESGNGVGSPIVGIIY